MLAWDLLKPLKRPIDGGATFRGRRLFGDNKTWRGALMMTTGPTAASVLLRRSEAYRRRLPPERLDHVSPLVPTRCEHCGAGLPAQAGPHDPEPTWHQFAELPPTIYQSRAA